MSKLTVFDEAEPGQILQYSIKHAEIARILSSAGVCFERWQALRELTADDDQATIIQAYQADIDRLRVEGGYQAVDVVNMWPDHPEREVFRNKFLQEHTHSEDEVRFFVKGQGLFSLHIGGKVYEVLCQRGDLISVPANTPHWFDMGPRPEFTAIRLFTNPEGWVADFTGSDIADRFNRLEK